MKMKLIIYVNPETGEIYHYIPTPDGQTVLIEPKIEKKENPNEEEPKVH